MQIVPPPISTVMSTVPRPAGAVAPSEGMELLGPAPAPLARLRGRYRFQILAKGPDQEALRCVAEQLRAASARLGEGLQASIDLRPLNML